MLLHNTLVTSARTPALSTAVKLLRQLDIHLEDRRSVIILLKNLKF